MDPDCCRCSTIIHSSRIGCYRCTERLLANGSDVNSTNLLRITGLHQACYHNHLDIVVLLLNNRANPQLKDIFGRRPIDITRDQRIKSILIGYM